MAFTRRGGRSPERAERVREAPAAQDACPRHLMEAENFHWGCFGGDARGAAKGAQPHNRPHLAARRAGVPIACQAKIPCPQGRQNYRYIILISGPRAAQASKTLPDGKIMRLKGRKNKGSLPRQAKNPMPAAQIQLKKHPSVIPSPHAAQASQSPVGRKIPCPKADKIKDTSACHF